MRSFIPSKKMGRRVAIGFMAVFNIFMIALMTLPGGASTVGAVERTVPERAAANKVIEYRVYNEIKPLAPGDNELSAAIGASVDTWLAKQQAGEFSYQVKGIDNGVLAQHNSGSQFDSASIYKLYLLKPLLDLHAANTWNEVNVNGRTLTECVDLMLSKSDNPCAEEIANKLGWNNVDAYMQSEGYGHLYKDGRVVATADDTNTLLARLWNKDYFGHDTSTSMLTSLATPKWSEAIRKGCINCTNVYNKTGEIANIKNDAAIIEVNGKAYAVTMFSVNASWSQLQDLTNIITSNL